MRTVEFMPIPTRTWKLLVKSEPHFPPVLSTAVDVLASSLAQEV